jgi:hypothetical protein
MQDNLTEKNSNQPNLNELISLSKAAELSGFTTRHLRLLATSGEIWAKKLGRNWFTTTQAVQEYLARDRKPGPKAK